MTISQIKESAVQTFNESCITQDPSDLFDLYGNAMTCAPMLEDYFFIDFEDYGYVLVSDSLDDNDNPCITVSLFNMFRGLPCGLNSLRAIFINKCIKTILEDNSFEIADLNNVGKVITEPYFAELNNKLSSAMSELSAIHTKLTTLFSSDYKYEEDTYYFTLNNPQGIEPAKATELCKCIKDYYDSLKQLTPCTFEEHCIKTCNDNPSMFKKI